MKKIIFSLASALIILSACNESGDQITPDSKVSEIDINVTTESVATTEVTIDDAVEAAEYEVELFSGTEDVVSSMSTLKSSSANSFHKARYRWGKCPLVTIVAEDGAYPKTITLDYGESTELKNGRILSGIVQIVISDKVKVDGATRTITYQDFYVDGVGIAGSVVKTFEGVKTEDKQVSIARDLSITLPEGVVINRTAEKTRVWTAGLDTPFDHSDDVMEITGWVNCEDSEDNTYHREITVALVKKGDCRFVVSGEVTITKGDDGIAVVNYGDGECDNVASLTNEEGTKDIIIGKHKRVKKQEKENS